MRFFGQPCNYRSRIISVVFALRQNGGKEDIDLLFRCLYFMAFVMVCGLQLYQTFTLFSIIIFLRLLEKYLEKCNRDAVKMELSYLE